MNKYFWNSFCIIYGITYIFFVLFPGPIYAIAGRYRDKGYCC